MLFTVMLACFPLAWFNLLPTDFVEYAKSVLSAIFSSSNFFFYFSTTEYGAPDAQLMPLLHTWSLGVEEQFYLVFPLFASILFRFFRSHLITIVIAFSLLSLQFSETVSDNNPALNFYFPFSRVWELFIGAGLAYFEIMFG